MHALDYWTTANALNVYQLSLLMAFYDPSDFEQNYAGNWSKSAKSATTVHIVAIKNAVISGIIMPSVQILHDSGGIDWGDTLISVSDFREWLTSRGITGTLFHHRISSVEDFTTPSGPFYAPKLAAAVDAWKAVTADPTRWRGKSPKKALEAWLRENATTYGLVNKDGTPNTTGIEEVAKVANWKPTGGAPATPAAATLPQVQPELSLGFGKTPPQVPEKPPHSSQIADLDDDFPF